MINQPKHIVISRTDSIGDVCLTLPLAGILKEKFPDAKITFLGNTYTQPVISCCKFVDQIWEWAKLEKETQEEQVNFLHNQQVDVFIHVFPRKSIARLAKKAGIAHRIGTSHRLFHWFTCNHKPSFTRKNSDLHEAQLNTRLLKPFGLDLDYTLTQLFHYAGFSHIQPLNSTFASYFKPGKKHLIFHPKSQGSAPEWELSNFINLAQQLDPAKYEIFFTGTAREGDLFRDQLPKQANIHDLSGKMNLNELISFIATADILLAASTGPLHLAGLTNIGAIGLFTSHKPMHPGRWKPLGNNVLILEDKKSLSSTQPLEITLRDVERALIAQA